MPKLTFDSRIPEEAALLDRLDGLPEERHLEYLRTLVVKGFVQEDAESPHRKHERSGSRVKRSRDNEPNTHESPPEPKTEPLKPQAQPSTAEPPADLTLASLKQLVG